MNDENINFDIDGTSRQYIKAITQAFLQTDWINRRERLVIYSRFEEILNQYFDNIPDSDLMRDHCYRLLRATIRFIEIDIRNGVDIFSEGYVPQDLLNVEVALDTRRQSLLDRLESQKRRQEATTTSSDLSPAEIYKVENSTTILAMLATSQASGATSRIQRFFSSVRALLVFEIQSVASDGAIALIWLLIQPAILLTIISLVYFFIATRFILNMDVATFAMVGSATWIMCRQTIFRVSSAFAGRRMLFNMIDVRPEHAAVAQALLYLIIYSCVFVLLIGGGYITGIFTLPYRPFSVLCLIVAMWLFAFAIGLVFGSIGVVIPLFLRFASVIERSLQMFSSVFFVSEQLPEEYKPYVLWSPTAHGMQSLRAAYFAGYEAPDANLSYFLTMLVVLLITGLLATRVVSWRIQPL